MLFAAIVLLVTSITGIVAALVIGGPTPTNPRHGTWDVSGLNVSFIAWGCAVMCVIGLVLLFVDARLDRRRPHELDAERHSAGDELFGEHDVERDWAKDH
jgi:hypothetical protein